ncbi:MAG: HAMP domain-containing histidine kinase [Thermaceae bacterium]|nr:HAMP domain-containing histidine kinase [Thermaceae bacterium]
MGFRNRLLLGLLALALGVAGLQLGLGYWSFRTSMDQDLQGDLGKYASLVQAALNLEGSEPTLNPAKLPISAELQGRFRLLREGRLMLEGAGPFPEADPAWLTYGTEMVNGYRLEVALNQVDHHRALSVYLRTGGFTLLLSALLAVAVALLLRGYLIRPLKRLEGATDALALERFPSPLPESSRDEIGRLTRSFNRMVQKVQRALEREKSFTRYVSHELRNPLAALKATAEAVRGGAMPPEELLPVLERNLGRMERILGGLLALVRGPGESTEVHFPEFLNQLLEDFPSSSRARIRLESDPATLQAPREALGAAVRNLLDNALRHGSGHVWLSFSNANPPRLSVRDQGPGVPAEAIERLGEPFFRPQSQREGLGLGLAFVRQVAEAIGGRLELRNHPEGGLEATLIFAGEPDV